jgi:hypothetical protein
MASVQSPPVAWPRHPAERDHDQCGADQEAAGQKAEGQPRYTQRLGDARSSLVTSDCLVMSRWSSPPLTSWPFVSVSRLGTAWVSGNRLVRVNQQNFAAADLVLPPKVLAERTASGHEPGRVALAGFGPDHLSRVMAAHLARRQPRRWN